MAQRTQNERVLHRLRQGGMCAMEPLGWTPPITRVGARIYDLRGEGHQIDSWTKCLEHGTKHAYYQLKLVNDYATVTPINTNLFGDTQ